MDKQKNIFIFGAGETKINEVQLTIVITHNEYFCEALLLHDLNCN